jgi:ribose transport system ATP-binding protein
MAGRSPLFMHDIVIQGLRKSFGRNEVLHGIDLTIPAGEFVGLMGPNGAGKSTLIKILGGVYSRTSGEISYGGKPVDSLADIPEVGFIHQDLGLVDDLTIADNLRLGEEPLLRFGFVLDRGRERDAARLALTRVELDCDPSTLVADLSPAEKALVAIARLLDRGARVLLIDEATSTLPPAEAKRLVDALAVTVAAGATVIMVSHKLSEILDVAQRVVVILDGSLAADSPASELDREALVQMLIVHESQTLQDNRGHRAPGDDLLRIEGAFGGRAGPVDLTLRAGEVLGLTGLPGSGLHDVAYLAHGSTQPRKGSVWLAEGARTALVPPHRESQGGFLELSVQSNMTMSSLARWRHPLRVLRAGAERRGATEMIEKLSVLPADPDAAFGTLSGGNKQKVVFGRVLFRKPQVYVLCEPTRGVDIGTRREIYRLIHQLCDEGAGVLVITSDSEDLFAVCDRIAVVDEGSLGNFIPVGETDAHELEAFI